MPSSSAQQLKHDLYRRYLLWAYKTTRESLERIERKTTQLVIDDYIKENIGKQKITFKGKNRLNYEGQVAEFDKYIATKRADEKKLKYASASSTELNPQYVFLCHRLEAIESAIVHFLGKKELKQCAKLFNEEFTRRILESRDH